MTEYFKWTHQYKALHIIGVLVFTMSLDVLGDETCSFGGGVDYTIPYTPIRTMGQYLDLNNTASCNGIVRSVQYCTTEEAMGNLSLRIWRPSEDNYTYTLIEQYTLNTPETSESVIGSGAVCEMMRVNVNRTIQVAHGDLVGLYIENVSLGVITSSFNESSSFATTGLYFDARASSESKYSTSIQRGDLIFNASLQLNVQIEIGSELSDPSVSPNLPALPSTTAHVNTTPPATSKTVHMTSTSSIEALIATPKSSLVMSSTVTPNPSTMNSNSFSTNSAMSISPSPTSSSSLPNMTSPSPMGVVTSSSPMGVVTSSATSIRAMFSTTVQPTMTVLTTSTLQDLNFNAETMILVAGVSAGCAFSVLLVAIVIVVCSILYRSPNRVHSSKRTRSLPRNNDLFVDSNVYPVMRNGMPDTVLTNEIRLHENFSPISQDGGSQGTETDDDYSRLDDFQAADKRASLHIYNTIATLRREQGNLLVPLPMERSQSDMGDYEVPVPSFGNHMTTLSLESVQPSNRTTMTFIPSDYEVPSTAMSEYCSDGAAVSDCSSTSYASIPEEPFVADNDMELWRRCKQALESEATVEKRNKIWRKPRRVESMDGPYLPPPTEVADLHKRLKELCIEFISMRDIQTELGMVQPSLITQKAVLKRKSGHDRPVILRSPDPAAETVREATIQLLQEAIIMSQLRHPNVVQLHGLIAEDKKLMLVTEQFPKEDLRRYLVQMGRSVILADAAKVLLTFSQQVALGMHYLASKGFVHRDLAARNVYVTKSDVCKVGALSKCLEYRDPEEYITKGGKLPIRWMSPEAMYKKRYSTASDVWAYGCLLYEIWSLGRMPFREHTNAQVIEKIDSGYRLPPPSGCPRVIYELMIKCWHPYALSRPSFKDILNTLLGDESQVLLIPAKDAATHEAAIVLGAKLESGKYLYQDLQTTYTQRPEVRRVPAGLHISEPFRTRSPQVPRQPPGKSDYDHISPHTKAKFTAFPTSSADIDHMYKPKGMATCTIPPPTPNQCTELRDEFDLSAFSFRQRLLTDDKSDYADIS